MATAPKKILVVEDDLVTQKVIGDILTAAGYQVLTARDAAGTMQTVRQEKPDLITLDVLLAMDSPTDAMDGLKVAAWLKRLDPHRETPIIVISGISPAQFGESVKALHPYAFLPKPVEKAKLLAIVANALK